MADQLGVKKPRGRGKSAKTPVSAVAKPASIASSKKTGRPANKITQAKSPAIAAGLSNQKAHKTSSTGKRNAKPGKKISTSQAAPTNTPALRAVKPPVAPATPKIDSKSAEHGFPLPDFEQLARNMPLILAEATKALSAALKPDEQSQGNPDIIENAADAVKTLGSIAEFWLSDPDRTIKAQQALYGPLIALWGHTWQRLNGETPEPVDEPLPGDRRFSDPQWKENPAFDFLRQAYAITTDWANNIVTEADGVDAFSREKAQFYVRQISGALSPSNFLATNPELLRKTLEENGANLVRGLTMLSQDIETGHGQLKIRQTDTSKFTLGVNTAMSPGKVIYRNALIELIQYSPTTPNVFKRPLLIVPPWINKFYVLDLNPEKSFVKYCADNGLTVFLVSWVNPDERHRDKSFEDYMREGILEALDAIEQATGESDVTAIGYCVGGTLLSITLAYMAMTGDTRISSTTLFTTQVDFTDAGDLKLFVDATRIKAIEERMHQSGYLDGSKMAAAFNMLRPNELIWGFFVNNYLKGAEPTAFDLLAWNSDSTRMPAANHSFYLRNCYLENTLTKGEMVIAGKKIDLGTVRIPIYNLAAREDHIAPPRSVFNGAKYFGGAMRYVLSGSGHIAGVVNPVSKPKYQFWTNPDLSGEYEDWIARATETPGTWWTDWIDWLTSQAPAQVPARQPGDGKLKPLCDAPGTYVLEKA
jgi:polyhydroxyalkanoate synthase subunit PhaC